MPLGSPVTIVDYGMGNVGSITNMIKKVGGASTVTASTADIAKASKLIIPGVGAFDAGMNQLRQRDLVEVLTRKAKKERVPVLGICLGLQLFTRRSEEGVLPGLAWIDAETRRFDFGRHPQSLRVPHMGWNEVTVRRSNPLLQEAEGPWRFYFVHSYHVCCTQDTDVFSTSSYGIPFTAGVAANNLLGVQFHPEKSHSYGMRLLRSFLEL